MSTVTVPPATSELHDDALEHPHDSGALAAPPESPPDGPDAPAATPAPGVDRSEKDDANDARVMKLLAGVAISGGVALAAIGFWGSYKTLRDLAIRKGFGSYAYAFPVGIDVGILVLYALDLYLTRHRIKLPLLRWMAHLLTAATIVFNAAASTGSLTSDPLASAMHGIIPMLFIAAVEAARHFIGRRAAILAGDDTEYESPPLSRWFLAPVPTYRIWRTMRLWGLPSYREVIERQRETAIHRRLLREDFGWQWRRKAPQKLLLPLTLRRFGLSPAEALAIPARRAGEDRLRMEADRLRESEAAASERLRAQEESVRIVIERADFREAEAAAEARMIKARGVVEAARFEAENAPSLALREREEHLRVVEAESAAEVEQIRLATERKTAEANREAAQAQARWQAEQDLLAAEEVRRLAEVEAAIEQAKQTADQARQDAAAAARQAAEDEAATARAQADKQTAERQAEEERLAAVRLRLEAAQREAAAADLEAEARLPLPEREARQIARLIADRGGDKESVRLPEIQERYGLAQTTASERRARAMAILQHMPELIASLVPAGTASHQA